MTWEVRPCRQYAKSTDHPSWRVQRWCQAGHQGAYEMAFVHEDAMLCAVIAALLNQWPTSDGIVHPDGKGGHEAVIQIRIPISLDAAGWRGWSSVP